MSEALTVLSHFEDVAQLAEGLADRVEEGRVILYGPTEYEAGEKIPFSVLLADGTAVIEGMGIVAASVDGGEDRDPAIRFDVVLTELEMDARSDVMFARILMSNDTSRETSLPVDRRVVKHGLGHTNACTSGTQFGGCTNRDRARSRHHGDMSG